MKLKRIIMLLPLTLAISLTSLTNANATLIPNPDGQTVYDTFLKVNWSANANLPGTKNKNFDGSLGLPRCDGTNAAPCIDPNGAMSYQTAVLWLETLNGLHGLPPYLGHTTWTIPRTPTSDTNCTVRDWGYNCINSALGSLYYQALPTGGPTNNLGFNYPDTSVPIPDNTVGPFRNFQPYLYWTSTSSGGSGENTFSFNTGWQGSNHTFHYMYALPMIPHKVERAGIWYSPVGNHDLQISSDQQMVYDPDAVDPTTGLKGVTWLADANLAATKKFGLQNCVTHGKPCIDVDGSMKYNIAVRWLDHMNHYHNADGTVGWLGQMDWEFAAADPTGRCDMPTLHCSGGPMGELFFNQLDGSQGSPLVPTPNINAGPFRNLQPYLYWACTAPDPCQGPPPPNGNQEWSFSFGNGFQGTDIVANNLYVTIYYLEVPSEALDDGIREELADKPHLMNQFLTTANQISSAPNYLTTFVALRSFISEVSSERGKALTGPEADYLEALAGATADARGFKPPPPPPCAPNCV